MILGIAADALRFKDGEYWVHGSWFLSWLIRVPLPWPSHWFQVYVTQGQSVSCKTEMTSGVYLIYRAKSNVQHMWQELSVVYLCYSLPDARNWKHLETEPPLLILERWRSINQITFVYASDQYLNWSSGLTGCWVVVWGMQKFYFWVTLENIRLDAVGNRAKSGSIYTVLD